VCPRWRGYCYEGLIAASGKQTAEQPAFKCAQKPSLEIRWPFGETIFGSFPANESQTWMKRAAQKQRFLAVLQDGTLLVFTIALR